jgi:hypothetical protein
VSGKAGELHTRIRPWCDQAPARAQHLGIISVYLQGIDNAEIIETVHARHAPIIRVSASLRL